MKSHPEGTIFVLRSHGFLGWLIRLMTRSRRNHAGICIGAGRTIEAECGGVVVGAERPVGPDVLYAKDFWQRVENAAPGRNLQIVKQARELIGTPYSFLDLIALAWACRRDPTSVPERPNWWQRRVMTDGRLICSQLVDVACDRAGVHLFTDGRLPGQVTPGDLEEVLTNPDWPQLRIDP